MDDFCAEGRRKFLCFRAFESDCVQIVNRTRQHSNTKIMMNPKMMFSATRPHSVDAFCRFSRLQTRSSYLKTRIFFLLNFHFQMA